MNEHKHLVDEYLSVNSQIRAMGFYIISKEECNEMLHKLVPFERPDMYAVLDEKIIILEHFEFDASCNTKKGMEGKREEACLERRIKETAIDGEWYIDKVSYEISFENWKNNFDYSFGSHYKKIKSYKENLQEETKLNNKEIIVGFFVEHKFPPVVLIDGKIGELPYVYTKQFKDVFKNSPEVDFILFGGYHRGKPELVYIDHESLDCLSDPIDLDSSRVSISHINRNECVLHGGDIITKGIAHE